MIRRMGCTERQRQVLARMVGDERLTLQEAAGDIDMSWLIRWKQEPEFRKALAATEELQRETLRHKCLVARLTALARPPAPATRPAAGAPADVAAADAAGASPPSFGPPPSVDDGQRTLTQAEFEELIRQCTPTEEDEL